MSSSDERRADLMKATKRELAEMYRNTFRLANRPSLSSVLSGHDKAGLVDQLLRIHDRIKARRD